MTDISASTVYVVDDDADTLRCLVLLLETEGLRAATFRSGDSFLAKVGSDAAGCVLLDLRMPGMSGLQLQQEMRARGYQLPVIVLSGHADVEIVVEAMQGGALSVLEKPCSPDTLVIQVRKALELDAQQRTDDGRISVVRERFAALSEKEQSIVELLSEGLDDSDICAKLKLYQADLDNCRANLMAKLKADSLPELIRLVLRSKSDS